MLIILISVVFDPMAIVNLPNLLRRYAALRLACWLNQDFGAERRQAGGEKTRNLRELMQLQAQMRRDHRTGKQWFCAVSTGKTIRRIALCLYQGRNSPARTAKGRMFSRGGSGQMAKSVKPQGGVKARLKSSVISVSVASSPIRNRAAA